MLQIISAWLAKPSGRYSDGVAIFEQLAPTEIKKKYLEYFKDVTGEPKQHDIHFTMLINKVSDIERKVKLNPKAFENIELVLKETGPDAITLAAIEQKNAKIAELKIKLQAVKSDNSDLISENENLTDTVENLESDLDEASETIEELESQISELETDIEALKAKRGVQIVAFKDMPEDLQVKFERTKVITPLMGSLHAQISVPSLHHKTREKLVKQLLELDDERREIWDAINDWSEGKEVAEDAKPEAAEYSADPLIAGAQIARRIERMKENIIRSQATADTSEKETIKENALARVESYKTELAELEAKLKPANPVEPKGEDEK
jgi:phage shock protein A